MFRQNATNIIAPRHRELLQARWLCSIEFRRLYRVPQDLNTSKKENSRQSSWQQLGLLNEVAADLSFQDYLSADTTEVLSDKEIVQLVSGAHEVFEVADDPETAEAPVPAPGQVMGAIDLLRCFGGAPHEGTKDTLNALACYEKYPPNANEAHAGESNWFFRQEISSFLPESLALHYYYERGLLGQ